MTRPDEAAEQAIREFGFWDYDLDVVTNNDFADEWVPDLAKKVATAVLMVITDQTVACSLCMFSERSPTDLTEDERDERQTLTVINGYMVCLSHQSYASSGEHSLMISQMKQNERRS